MLSNPKSSSSKNAGWAWNIQKSNSKGSSLRNQLCLKFWSNRIKCLITGQAQGDLTDQDQIGQKRYRNISSMKLGEGAPVSPAMQRRSQQCPKCRCIVVLTLRYRHRNLVTYFTICQLCRTRRTNQVLAWAKRGNLRCRAILKCGLSRTREVCSSQQVALCQESSLQSESKFFLPMASMRKVH
jgi:hypothetical protein